MIYKRLMIDLVHNNRTQAGLESTMNDFEVDGYGTLLDENSNALGYSVYISRGDLGRWDCEGNAYVADLLGCVEADILGVEEDWLTPEEQEALSTGEAEVVS